MAQLLENFEGNQVSLIVIILPVKLPKSVGRMDMLVIKPTCSKSTELVHMRVKRSCIAALTTDCVGSKGLKTHHLVAPTRGIWGTFRFNWPYHPSTMSTRDFGMT